MKRTPLRAKRETPRRAEGRVVFERMKPKAKAAPTAEEKRHLDNVARHGCIRCGHAACVHHIMHAPGKIRRRDHRFVAPLCPDCHAGRYGVHGLGSEAAFEEAHGINLVEWAARAWDLRNELRHPFWSER